MNPRQSIEPHLRPWLHRLPALVAATAAVAAGWLLHRELRHLDLASVRGALSQLAPFRLLAAVGLTIVNYSLLVGYDALALREVGLRLPARRVAAASLTSFAASHNLGAWLGGATVRYRFYSGWGLSAGEIARILTLVGATHFSGLCVVSGVLFTLSPVALPWSGALPFSTLRPLGAMLSCLSLAYAVLVATVRRSWVVWGVALELPRPPTALAQALLGAADLMVAASALYVVLPPELHLAYPTVLTAYLAAVVLTILSHVPGGVGVFELVVLTLCSAQSSEAAVASLLAFRAIYYLLPLCVAVCLMARNELAAPTARAALESLGRWSASVAPVLLAFAAFAAGTLLVWSGTTPGVASRLKLLEAIFPLALVEVSHVAASVVGAGLILLARGLQRRLDSAYWVALGSLGVGAVASVLKGLDYEEATVLATVAGLLYACRRQFYRRGSLVHEPFGLAWWLAFAAVVSSSLWLGRFAYRHLEYSSELLWQFEFRGDAPRFLRATVAVAGLGFLFGLRRLIAGSPARRPRDAGKEAESVAAIVASASRVEANLALLGDKRFLLSEHGDALVMYGVEGRSWIAMGGPCGPPDRAVELIWAFRQLADRHDGRAAFYRVSEPGLSAYVDAGFSLAKLGEEAHVALAGFGLEGSAREGLRQTHQRALRAGCRFAIVQPQEVAPLLGDLQAISNAWLEKKGGAEKGFALGFFDAAYLCRFPCALVLWRNRPVAFANVWASSGGELSIDLMRYDLLGPAGGDEPAVLPPVMDFLLIELMLWGRSRGYSCFNLGMAPLSGMLEGGPAPVWSRAAALAYHHGGAYHGFEGLRKHKEKFRPVWRPRYLAHVGLLSLPVVLRDVAALIGREPKRAGRLEGEPPVVGARTAPSGGRPLMGAK